MLLHLLRRARHHRVAALTLISTQPHHFDTRCFTRQRGATLLPLTPAVSVYHDASADYRAHSARHASRRARRPNRRTVRRPMLAIDRQPNELADASFAQALSEHGGQSGAVQVRALPANVLPPLTASLLRSTANEKSATDSPQVIGLPLHPLEEDRAGATIVLETQRRRCAQIGSTLRLRAFLLVGRSDDATTELVRPHFKVD